MSFLNRKCLEKQAKNKNTPKTGYRLHSKFKWEAKSPGYRQLGNKIARQRAIAQQTLVQWSQAIAQASLSRAKGKELAKSQQS